jgi:hypothetical protein
MEREDCGCGCLGIDKAPAKDAEGAKNGDTSTIPVEAKDKREGK